MDQMPLFETDDPIDRISLEGSNIPGGGRGSLTYKGDNFSVTPSGSFSSQSRKTQFEDGVILDESGKQVGVAIDGEIKLSEGVSLRGGLEKVFSRAQGDAYYNNQRIGGYDQKGKVDSQRLGATVGKLGVDYQQTTPDMGEQFKNISAVYKIKDTPNESLSVSGSTGTGRQPRFGLQYNKRFAEGGSVEQMNRLFQEGGMMQEGGTIDPVSGNEVPVGSMQEEVRDDIDAKLSEGEFVFPADVVRFIGLEKLMKIRDQAKQGLQRMDEMGQMGNAEEVGASVNEMFEDDDNFESELDSVMSEVEAEEGATQEFAFGGLAGEDLAKAPKNPSIDTRYFKHADGRVMYIVFVNDKPSVKIPEGFEPMDGPVEQQVGKEAEEKAAAVAVGVGDAGGGPSEMDILGAAQSQAGPSALGQTSLISVDSNGKASMSTMAKGAQVLAHALPFGSIIAGKIGTTAQAQIDAWNNSQIVNIGSERGKVNNLGGNSGFISIQDATSGMGINDMGFTVSTTETIEAQNADLLEGLTPAEKAMYAVPTPSGGGGGGGSGSSGLGIDFGSGVDPEAGGMGHGQGQTVGLDAFGGVGPSVGGDSGGSSSSSSSAADAAAVADAAASVEGAGIAAAGGGDSAAAGSGGCFITTAAVEHNNEPDEGKLLTTLRKFRDNYMKKDPEKMKDVKWYYDNAPAIVKGLNNLKNSKVVYNRIYQQYLRPAMKAIEEGDNKKAYTIYKNVMKYSAEKAGVKEKSLEKQVDNKKKGIASRNKDVS